MENENKYLIYDDIEDDGSLTLEEQFALAEGNKKGNKRKEKQQKAKKEKRQKPLKEKRESDLEPAKEKKTGAKSIADIVIVVTTILIVLVIGVTGFFVWKSTNSSSNTTSNKQQATVIDKVETEKENVQSNLVVDFNKDSNRFDDFDGENHSVENTLSVAKKSHDLIYDYLYAAKENVELYVDGKISAGNFDEAMGSCEGLALIDLGDFSDLESVYEENDAIELYEVTKSRIKNVYEMCKTNKSSMTRDELIANTNTYLEKEGKFADENKIHLIVLLKSNNIEYVIDGDVITYNANNN